MIGNSSVGLVYKISNFTMFLVQFVAIGVKVVYLESVTQELAQYLIKNIEFLGLPRLPELRRS